MTPSVDHLANRPTHRCADCAAGLAHCHGTLVLHDPDGRECTEAGCDAAPARHALSIPCAEVGCPCAARPAVGRAA